MNVNAHRIVCNSGFMSCRLLYLLLGCSIAVSLIFFCVILDRVWRRQILNTVQNAKALADGSTVRLVLSRKYPLSNGNRRQWWVENGDFPYCEAKVFCEIDSDANQDKILYAWQWDRTWPSPRALTPLTVELCPELDPQCDLTVDGKSTLWTGRRAMLKYFKAPPVPDQNAERGQALSRREKPVVEGGVKER